MGDLRWEVAEDGRLTIRKADHWQHGFGPKQLGYMPDDWYAAMVAAVRDAARVSTLRRLVYELAHGNRPQLFEGRLHWYSPDENGRPHYLNGPLTDAEVAEWEALEAGE